MLRLIAMLIIVTLIVGPIALQLGVLDNAGGIRTFFQLEVSAYIALLDHVRSLWANVG